GHRIAGEFLEAAGERDAAVVADHFERSGDRERAATSYLRAAEGSLTGGDDAGARRLVVRGLGCAPEGEVLGRLKSVHSYAGISLDAFEGVAEDARLAMTLLRPGSLGWWRAMAAAVLAETTNPARMLELVSLLGSTDPEPDAGIVY